MSCVIKSIDIDMKVSKQNGAAHHVFNNFYAFFSLSFQILVLPLHSLGALHLMLTSHKIYDQQNLFFEKKKCISRSLISFVFAVVVNFRCLLFHIFYVLCRLSSIQSKITWISSAQHNWVSFRQTNNFFFWLSSSILCRPSIHWTVKSIKGCSQPFTAGLLNDACTYRDVNIRNNSGRVREK